jgi:hypothetical protein
VIYSDDVLPHVAEPATCRHELVGGDVRLRHDRLSGLLLHGCEAFLHRTSDGCQTAAYCRSKPGHADRDSAYAEFTEALAKRRTERLLRRQAIYVLGRSTSKCVTWSCVIHGIVLRHGGT